MPSSLRTLPTLCLLALALTACTTPDDRANRFATDAEKHLAAGDLAKARMEAQNAVQVAPKNVRARYVLAQVAEQNGELGQMLGHLEVVIGEDPTHVASRVKMATLLLYAQDYEGAAGLAAAARELAPDDPSVRLLDARLLLQKGDVPAGLRELDFVLEKQPQNAGAALIRGVTLSQSDPERGLADLAASAARLDPEKARPLREARIKIYGRLGRHAEVEREIQALVRDFPRAGYAKTLADFYVGRQRIADAEAALVDGIAADPDDVDLKFAYAQFQSRTQNRPDLAEASLRKFIAAAPDDLRLPVLLGTFYEARNRDADALAEYRSVAARAAASPDGIVARNRIAVLTLKAGDAGAAREMFDGILQDSPDDATALIGRGQLHLAGERYEDAVADLRAALRKVPDNLLALTLLADAQVRAGDLDLAEDAWRRVLQVTPDDPVAQSRLVDVLLAAGRPDDAIAAAEEMAGRTPGPLADNNLAALLLDHRSDAASHERALALAGPFAGSGNPQLLDTLGWAKYRTGNPADAVKYLRLALSLAGDNPIIRYHLGMAYLAAKNNAGARQELEKALKLASQFPGADEARAALQKIAAQS